MMRPVSTDTLPRLIILNLSPALPRGIRKALLDFANEAQITTVMDHLSDLITTEGSEEVPTDFVVPDDEINIAEWETGVENLQTKSMDDLWADLGLSNIKAVPGFNTREDPTGNIDPWSTEGAAWLADENNGRPFAPQWHQLCGAVGMLLRRFSGRSTLLMDEVGVGKTMQVIMFQMLLIWLRSYRDQHGEYPGMFSKCCVIIARCTDMIPAVEEFSAKTIPDLPMIIVVPVSLVQQYKDEIRRYTKPGVVDVIPYTGTVQSRRTFWTAAWNVSRQPLCRRILLATSPVSLCL